MEETKNTAGKQYLELAKSLAQAKDMQQTPELWLGELQEKDSKARLIELLKEATIEECNKAGSPAQPVAYSGKVGVELIDTNSRPNIISAHANADRLNLATEAECIDLAIDAANTIQAQNSIERMLAHQLAALHSQAMKLMAKSSNWLENPPIAYASNPTLSTTEAVRLANSAARMMATYHNGMLALTRFRSGGKQEVNVIHQHVQVAGGNVAIAGNIDNRGRKNGD